MKVKIDGAKVFKIVGGLLTIATGAISLINQKNDMKALKAELKDDLLKELGK